MKNVIFLDFKNKRRVEPGFHLKPDLDSIVREMQDLKNDIDSTDDTEEILALEHRLNEISMYAQEKYNLKTEAE